jgi:hypothetical protein
VNKQGNLIGYTMPDNQHKTMNREDIRSSDEQIAVMKRLTQSSAAWVLGIADRTLRRLEAPRQADGTYSAKEIHAWDAERRQKGTEQDPLMNGSDSPALEEYRRQKVRELTRKNDREEGKLVSVVDMIELVTIVGTSMRNEFEAVERAFPDNKEIHEMYKLAIERGSSQLMEHFQGKEIDLGKESSSEL